MGLGVRGVFWPRSTAMSDSPFSVESLESRRLLSGGSPSVQFPLDGTTLLLPTSLLSAPGSSGPVTRQGPVNGGFEQFPDFTGWQTAGNDLVFAADFHAPAEGTAQGVLS